MKLQTKVTITGLFAAALAGALLLGDYAKTKQAETYCFGPAMPQNELCQNVKAPHLN